jgi:hypothetical protein
MRTEMEVDRSGVERDEGWGFLIKKASQFTKLVAKVQK